MEQTIKNTANALAILLILGLFNLVSAALNPAAVYCDSLGFEYVSESTDSGDYGYCMLSGNEKVDAWMFIKGEASPEKSYCAQMGYELRTVNNYDICGKRLLSEVCAVCILPNGTEREVTELMGLSFKETSCGDGRCGLPENYDSCPQDCKSGEMDDLCDGESDGRCDQDCVIQNKAGLDEDCSNPIPTTTIVPGPLNLTAKPLEEPGKCLPMLPAIIALVLSLLVGIPYMISKK